MSENSPRGSKGGTGEEEEVTRVKCTQAAVGVHCAVVGRRGSVVATAAPEVSSTPEGVVRKKLSGEREI